MTLKTARELYSFKPRFKTTRDAQRFKNTFHHRAMLFLKHVSNSFHPLAVG